MLHWQHRITFAFPLLISIVVLCGCTPHHINDDINEYATRLARVLDTPEFPQHPVALLAYPQREVLFTSSPVLDMNLTRFYQLQQCALGNLVAERNTALGKIQALSQRLAYEQRLLGALTECIEVMAAREDDSAAQLLQLLRDWQTSKQAAYSAHWSNMLVLSDETKAAFSRPQPDLLFADKLDIAGQRALFTQLGDYHSAQHTITDNLETTLQAIGATRLPASVWQAQHQLAVSLPPLTSRLDPLLAAVSCNTSSAPAQADILRNVFYLFFIEKIQPVGGHINDFNYQFARLLNSWQTADALPDDFKAYLRLQQQQFAAYQQAMGEHVKLWQRFLARCHLSPVAPAG